MRPTSARVPTKLLKTSQDPLHVSRVAILSKLVPVMPLFIPRATALSRYLRVLTFFFLSGCISEIQYIPLGSCVFSTSCVVVQWDSLGSICAMVVYTCSLGKLGTTLSKSSSFCTVTLNSRSSLIWLILSNPACRSPVSRIGSSLDTFRIFRTILVAKTEYIV